MSPFSHVESLAQRGNPILLIHGDNDDNTGTFPIQSERYYAALKGTYSGQFLCQPTPTLFRPFLAHFFPSFPLCFRRLLRLAPKIQDTGTKTRKNGPQRSKNGGHKPPS